MRSVRVLAIALLVFLPAGWSAAANQAQRQRDCVTNPAQVVDDIYQQVLERPADTASAGLTQALESGRLTVRDIVLQVAKSEEHARRFYWQPIVGEVYRQVLGRTATDAELREGATRLSSDGSTLPEFIAHTATRAANNEEGAVRILYRRLLGRDPDPAGLNAFTDLSQRRGIEAVAREIVASPEYRRRAGAGGLPTEDLAAYESAVRSLYRHLLGRDPDPAGLRNLTRIAAAQGAEAVIDRMITSPEYARQYGTDQVPGRNVRYCGPTR
jgi:hypothetical protein